jgi:hypothetical protein
MAKPFACRVVAGESVTVRVLDSTARLILSKDGPDEVPTALLQASSTTLVASGAGNTMALTCDDGAGMHLVTDGADLLLENSGTQITSNLASTGNLLVTNTNGNVVTTAGQIVETAQIAVINGTATVLQTMLTLGNSATLNPSNANYAELGPSQATGLNLASRLDVFPNAAGTTIDSIIIASPNPDGRQIAIQNIGTAGGQTLTLRNQNDAGTAGGKFFGPGDYVIPAGGGVIITFDSTAPGFWFVRGV